MGSGFKKKKKQLQAFQEQIMSAQEEMKSREVIGESGGGLVSIKLNGEYEMLELNLKKDCIDPDDQEGLEDLIKSAYQQALSKLKETEASFADPSLMSLLGH